MKNEKYKIKSYGNIYGPNRGNRLPIKIILIIAAIVLCSLLGWSLYIPVYNFFMGFNETSDSSKHPAVSPSESSMVSSPETPASKTEEQVPSNTEAVIEKNGTKGIYIPNSLLSNYSALDNFLDRAKENGYTSVILDAKSATGEVLFLTENEIAINGLVTSSDAFDAVTIVRHIKEKGLEPIAKLHAFRDDKCAKANNDMGVKYYDTKYIWLDNAPESGGRAWLNPYNEKSRQYIAALCGELSKKGFSKIIVDSLQFPSGLGREKSGYGNMYEEKSAVLKDCIKEISDAVKANGGMATFIFDVNGIESDSEMLYGGDVIEFYENNVMLSTSLEKIDSAVTIASRFKGKSGKTPEIMLQAYNNDGGQPTQDDMQKAIEKLGKIDVTGYCLFNPQGIYQF